MPRPRTLPDAEVFATIHRLLAEGGDKAVAFGSVARATGLAAPTLVQRYGSRDGMVQAARLAQWDAADAALARCEGEAGDGAKGAQALLKALGDDDGPGIGLTEVDLRDPVLRARAEGWRQRVEGALALRLGGGDKAQMQAALLFATWQGGLAWQQAGGRAFRLKDMVKRLT